MLLGMALDFALVGVFRSNLRQALNPQRYRAAYPHTGRRKRVGFRAGHQEKRSCSSFWQGSTQARRR